KPGMVGAEPPRAQAAHPPSMPWPQPAAERGADDRRRAPRGRAASADHDRLQLGELLDRVTAADAADAAVGARAAAEGEVVLPVVGGLVDVDEAGPDLVGEAQAVHHVAREDR